MLKKLQKLNKNPAIL